MVNERTPMYELATFNTRDKTLAVVVTQEHAEALLELLQIADDPRLEDITRQINCVLPAREEER